MSKRSIQDCDDCVAPAEAFSLISNETRLAILEALWKVPERPAAFSTLRKEVGMRDSAQFNYHLQKLDGHFITKGEEGYDLRYAGKKVIRSILAGSLNEHPDIEPFPVEGSCATCGESLRAAYVDELLEIRCTECGQLHGRYPFPPGGLNDRDEAEIMEAFNQRVRHLHCLAADGVCPECNGRMETHMCRDEEGYLGTDVRVEHRCAQCDHHLNSTVGLSLLDNSAVVSFHADHGVDLCAKPYWDLAWCVTDAATTVLSEDPWEFRVDIDLDEEVLRVRIDDELAVTEVTRGVGSTPSERRTA